MKQTLKTLEQSLQEIIEVGRRWHNIDGLNQTAQALLDMADEQRTRIMLFGAYSAGKSTVVNALLGREDAAVDVTPTTDCVNDYQWGDVLLQDTPGINAPIEHEAVTEEALSAADMVVFVIHSGDHDTQDVYHRMLSMMATDKPVMVVLNYEAAQSETDQQVARVNRAINEHLQNLSADYGVSDEALAQLQIIPLQARSALKARLENKHRLLENSGYPLLAYALSSWANSIQAQAGRRQAILDCLQERLVGPLMATIEQQQTGQSHPQLDQARQDQEHIEAEWQRMTRRVRAEAERLAAQARLELADIVNDTESSKAERESRLESLYQSLQEQVIAFMLEELPDLDAHLAPGAGGLELDDDSDSTSGAGKLDDILNQAKHMAPRIPKDGAAKLVDQARKAKKLPKGLEKLAKGKAGEFLKRNSRYVGVGVAVGIEAAQLGKVAYDQKRENERLKADEMRRQQQLSGLLKQMGEHLADLVVEALDARYQPLIESSQERCSELSRQVGQAEADLEALKGLSQRLMAP